jgi:hypothetical protein
LLLASALPPAIVFCAACFFSTDSGVYMVEIERMTMAVIVRITINEGKSDNETHISVVVIVVINQQ